MAEISQRGGLDRNHRAGRFGGSVDGLDEGEAPTGFEAVTQGRVVVPDGVEEVFENGLVATKIADGSRRGALILVVRGFDETGRGGGGFAEIRGDDAVVFEDDGAFGAGDFDAARVAGIGGCGGVKSAESTICEFKNGDGGVFRFDFVKQGGGAGLDSDGIPEKPEK